MDLVCVNFATFVLSWCKVIESLHSYIPKIQATNVSSSWFVSTPCGPYFFDLIFPFKWLERYVISIYQKLLVFFKDNCLFSTISIVASSTSDVHLPRCVKLGTLFTIASFFSCAGTIGGMFYLLVDCLSCRLFCLLQGTMDIMVLIPFLLVLDSSKLGGPISSYKGYIFEPLVWTPRLL